MKKTILILFAILFLTTSCSNSVIQNVLPSQKAKEQTTDKFVLLTKEDLCKTYSFSSYTKSKTYDFVTKMAVKTNGRNNEVLAVDVALPQNARGKQNVQNIEFSPEPEKIYQSGENIFAMFRFENPKPREIIKISGRVNVNVYDYDTAKAKPIRELLSPSDRKKYISPEKMIESTDKDIVEVAKSLQKNNDVNTTFAIYNYVLKNIKYVAQPQVQSAKETLLKGSGKCTDYSALMVALCRANKIPARIVSGNIISSTGTRHSWVEVYFEQYGWVYFEPTIISDTLEYMKDSPYTYFVTAKNVVNTVYLRLRQQEENEEDFDVQLDDMTIFSEVK